MRFISESFIWAIGITQPKAGQEQRAARYITLLILAVIFAAAAVFWGLMRVFK